MKAQIEKEAAEAAAQATKKAEEAKVAGKAAKVTAKSKRAEDGAMSKTKNKEAGAAGGSKTAVNEGTEAATGAKCDAGGAVGVGAKGEVKEVAVDEVDFKADATANGATGDNQVGVEYFVQREDNDSCEDSLVQDPEIGKKFKFLS